MAPRQARGATLSISTLPLGKVIQINGRKFVKITSAPNNDSKFLALTPACVNDYIAVGAKCVAIEDTMQGWTGCIALATPTGTNFTPGPILTDTRDGKTYEIRKFSDGKCWLVDQLMYGGGTDGVSDYCAGKSAWRNANSAANVSAIATNGLNPPDGSRNTLFGDCLDPRVSNAAPCTAGSTACGYFYNWAAAIQSASGYAGIYFAPSEPTQGICPSGWHIPSRTDYNAIRASMGAMSTSFYQPGGNWKGVYTGLFYASTSFYRQGSWGYYLASCQISANNACYFGINPLASYEMGNDTSKNIFMPVRCLKN